MPLSKLSGGSYNQMTESLASLFYVQFLASRGYIMRPRLKTKSKQKYKNGFYLKDVEKQTADLIWT